MKNNIIPKYYNKWIIPSNKFIEDWLYGSSIGFLRKMIDYKQFGIFLKKVNK